MRKIIDKILNQKKFILGTIFGVMIMGGISYAANNYTSESVSYTRGNDTMSVKQALDDLIVKVDKKSGNFNIELAERPLGINFTESTTTYQSLVNDLLGRMITAMGTANTADLSAIKSSTLTWKSEDPNTASVTGTVVKGVKEGKTKIIGTATNGKQVIVPVNVKSAVVLAEKAHVGEYVAYDAGQWNADAARPTKSGQFGGYSKNQSKNASVEWCNLDSHKTT